MADPLLKTGNASWLIPTVVSGVVSVVAITQGYLLARSAQENEKNLEVAKLKLQVIQSLNAYDFRTAQILMTHVLKPIDHEQAYNSFQTEFSELLAERAPTADPSERAGLEVAHPVAGAAVDVGITALTDLFRGPERLTASNELIALYEQKPRVVVQGLLNALLPDDDRAAYTVNLYVVFTLARLKPHWLGTKQQLQRVKSLRSSKKYRDKTFRQRVEEAIENWAQARA